jgi:hypothetical protein
MRQNRTKIEQALSGGGIAAAQRAGGYPSRQNATQDAEFNAVVQELAAMYQNGQMPEGFDLQQAANDPALMELIQDYGAEAGVRIYAAEQRANKAEQAAMQRVSAQVRSRNALPRSSRGGSTTASAPNYRDMSSEAFRSLLQQMKKTARDGGRTRL